MNLFLFVIIHHPQKQYTNTEQALESLEVYEGVSSLAYFYT